MDPVFIGLLTYAEIFPVIAYLLVMAAVFACVKNGWQRYLIILCMALILLLQGNSSFNASQAAVNESNYWENTFRDYCGQKTTSEIFETAKGVSSVRQYVDHYPHPNPYSEGLYPNLVNLDRVNGYAEVEYVYGPKNDFHMRLTRSDGVAQSKKEYRAPLRSRYGLEWEPMSNIKPNRFFSGKVLVIVDYETKKVMARHQTYALHSPDIFFYRGNMVPANHKGMAFKTGRYLTCPSAMELHDFVYRVLQPKWQ